MMNKKFIWLISILIIMKIIKLKIKINLYLGQKVEKNVDFHTTKIPFLLTKTISTTKTRLRDKFNA